MSIMAEFEILTHFRHLYRFLDLGRLCQHHFECDGSQINVTTIDYV